MRFRLRTSSNQTRNCAIFSWTSTPLKSNYGSLLMPILRTARELLGYLESMISLRASRIAIMPPNGYFASPMRTCSRKLKQRRVQSLPKIAISSVSLGFSFCTLHKSYLMVNDPTLRRFCYKSYYGRSTRLDMCSFSRARATGAGEQGLPASNSKPRGVTESISTVLQIHCQWSISDSISFGYPLYTS